MVKISDLAWPRRRIQMGYLNGEIVVLSAVGGTVKFLCKNGVDAGHLADSAGGIKRFRSDARAWAWMDKMKTDAAKK